MPQCLYPQKIANYPQSYVVAKHLLNGKFSQCLSANTRLRLEDNNNISVILYDTAIVIFKPNGGILLHSEGYRTPTTLRRINQCLPLRYRVRSHKKQWVVYFNAAIEPETNCAPFYDGIALEPCEQEGAV